MVYVNVPEMSVTAAIVNYTSSGALAGIKLHSPVADTTVSVDADGFIVTIRSGRADLITPPARPAAASSHASSPRR